MRTHTITTSILTALAFASDSPLFAGEGGPTDLPVGSVLREAHGVTTDREGRLIGIGPDFRAHFEADAFRFVPALGAGAQREESLSYRLTSIERGGRDVDVTAHGAPAADGRVVRYARGAAHRFTERYEVRRDGIELSFVFDSLPGAGDLVVRGRLSTDLPLASGSDDGFSFRRPDGGGVDIGVVTGIDADGRRARGGTAVQGDEIVFTLPSAFVDTASFPLVLDPVIKPVFTVNGDSDELSPDVAYDVTNDVYFVAWERRFSTFDSSIFGQRLDADGNLVGAPVALATGGTQVRTSVSVANVNGQDRFVVAYQAGPTPFTPFNVQVQSVNALTGQVSAAFPVPNQVVDRITPDVGGDSRSNGDQALLVWDEQGVAIQAASLTIDAVGAISFGTVFDVETEFITDGFERPAISKSGGPLGRHLVAWSALTSIQSSIFARAVTLDGQTVGSSEAVDFNATNADIDGDGEEWLVVYQQQLGTNVRRQLMGFNTQLNRVERLGENTQIEAGSSVKQADAAVALADTHYLVAWSEEVGAGFDNVVRHARLTDDGELCGAILDLTTADTHDIRPRLASELSGGGSDDRAMLVYRSATSTPPFASTVKASLLEAVGPGGPVTDLGGGCGQGGGLLQAVGAAATGNPNFQLVVTGAQPTEPAGFLNITVPQAPITCGSCLISPFGVIVTVPLVNGSIFLPATVGCDPSSVGAQAELQFLVFNTPASPCPALAGGLSFSNRLLIEIGE